MRLVLLGLVGYLVGGAAIVGGAAALLLFAVDVAITKVPVQQGAREVAPRVQMWLDRKAEALVYAERQKAAAVAEKERTEALRIKIPSAADHEAFARVRDQERRALEREMARSKDKPKRTTTQPSRQPSVPERADGSRVARGLYPDLHGRTE
jgi:hypothetical protein